ncbi:MAG: PAS domain S-box protein, partial [Candidatus Zixiibacteriota bacterium]
MASEKKESKQRKRKDKKIQDTKTAHLPEKKVKRSLGVGMGTSKDNQQVLRENEEKYRHLIEQSLQGIVVTQDFRIIFANTAITEISGYTKKELLSFSPQQLKSIIYPEDQMLVWGRFRDRLAGKPVPPHHEYRIKRKDGTIAWIETFATRIEYE